MNCSQSHASRQQRRVLSHTESTDAFGFFNPLTGPRLLDEVEALLSEHRERLFPPTETLSTFLAQALLDAGQAETWRNVRFDIDQGRSERLGSALRLANTEIKQNDIRPSTRWRKVDWRRAHQ